MVGVWPPKDIFETLELLRGRGVIPEYLAR